MVRRATDIEQAASMVMARRYSVMSSNKSVFLHVFADASTKAYGAVAYLQNAENVDFKITCIAFEDNNTAST